MNQAQNFFNQSWGSTAQSRRANMETPQTMNQLNSSGFVMHQRQQQLQNSYQQVMGGQYPQPQIMVNNQMLHGRQDKLARENNYNDNRFVTQEAYDTADRKYKGLSRGSRFYAKELVTPETIAADIGTSAFSLSGSLANSTVGGDSSLTDGRDAHRRTTEDVEMRDDNHTDKGMSQGKYVSHGAVNKYEVTETVNRQKLTGRNFDNGF